MFFDCFTAWLMMSTDVFYLCCFGFFFCSNRFDRVPAILWQLALAKDVDLQPTVLPVNPSPSPLNWTYTYCLDLGLDWKGHCHHHLQQRILIDSGCHLAFKPVKVNLRRHPPWPGLVVWRSSWPAEQKTCPAQDTWARGQGFSLPGPCLIASKQAALEGDGLK